MAIGIQPMQNGPGTTRSVLRPQSLDIGESQGTSRRAGLSLPLNTLAIPVPFFSTPDRETVEQEGESLFQYFVQERLASEGLEGRVVPNLRLEDGGGDIARPGPPVSTPDGYKNSILARHGSNLRDIADQFAQSKENALVRAQADNVNLDDITKESFLRLLQELFRDGFKSERLIALFFFCFYLIIRAILEKREQLFQGLFLWSLLFIKDNVCKWVYEHGGWGKVLSNIYDILFKVGMLCLIAVSIGALSIYIAKHMR